jgi:two-component system cell cycle response regulator
MARILVIEDDPNSLELIAYLLGAFGYTPITAVDGEEGVAKALSYQPDLILCDVQIPKVHGFEVVRQLKNNAAFAQVPIIAVTAFAMVGDRDKVLGAGFDSYITKPIAPETFIAQMESFLAFPNQSHTQIPAQGSLQPEHSFSATITTPTDRHISILVLDNSPTNLEFLHSLLQLSGYHVLTATTINEAMTIASQNLPQLIISDLQLNGESGFDFIARVKAHPQLKSIPFLFLTSTAWKLREREQGIEAGATKYLLRPIEPQVLLAEIEACFPHEHSTTGDEDRNR